MKLHTDYIDAMILAYRECMLWAEGGDGELSGMTDDDISQELSAQIAADCASFYWRARPWLLPEHPNTSASAWTADEAGHDFYLTRNGHGTGFWDRQRGHYGDSLTNIAHTYGELTPYLGDDGLIY